MMRLIGSVMSLNLWIKTEMRIKMKPKLTTEQLMEHLIAKGITFNHMTKKEASYCLRNLNYYYKLGAYRKNFSENKEGKYINLDFAYLTDLAAIDTKLRQFLLSLCLDIEHGVKVLLLDQISNFLPNEDGYQIVQDFRNGSPYGFEQYNSTIKNLKSNQYLKEMSRKYADNPPVWVFLETTSFGGLTSFVEYFYINRKSTKKLKTISSLLKYCKNIRNACAHNTPILVNLFSELDHLDKRDNLMTGIANTIKIDNKDTYYGKMVDLISVFYLHKLLQSERSGDFQHKQGKMVLERYYKHNWYSQEKRLEKFMNNFSLLVDYLI